MYDAAIGRFMVTDRFSEKYFDFTPYQYGANNPLRYVDVNGDSIVGTDGMRVTYTRDSETGKTTWSDNADHHIKKIGNAMLYTEEGTKWLDNMINSENKITLKVADKDPDNPNRKGVSEYGDITQKDGKQFAGSVDITIYEGTINENTKRGGNDYNNIVGVVGENQGIAATAAHEAVHSTDPDNMHTSIEAFRTQSPQLREQREIKPRQVQKKVIQQAYKKWGKEILKSMGF